MKHLVEYIIEKFKIKKDIKIKSTDNFIVFTSNNDGYAIQFKIFDNQDEVNEYYDKLLRNQSRQVDRVFKCDISQNNELIKRWKELPLQYNDKHKEFYKWLKENNIQVV